MSETRLSVDQMLALADRLRREGRLTDSEEACRRVLKNQPNQPKALYLLALVFIERKAFDRAMVLLRTAIELAPRDPTLRNALGNVAQLMGDFRAAETAYRESIEINPQHATAHANLGAVLFQQGRFDLALAALDVAFALEPGNIKTSRWRAATLEKLGRNQDALTAVNAILARQPDDLEALHARGLLNTTLGQFGAAVGDYLRIVAARPNSAGALVLLARALNSSGRLPEALAALEKAISIEETPGSLIELATMHLESHSPAESLTAARRAAQLGRDDAELHYLIGTALVQIGQVEEGIEELQRCVRLDPSSSRGFNNLGGALREIGRLDEAYDALSSSVQIDPLSAVALFNLGLIRRVTRESPALPLFERAEASIDSFTKQDRVHAHYLLGKVRADLDEHDEAFRHFQAGASCKRSLIQYDEPAMFAFFDRGLRTTALDFAAGRPSANQSEIPIFVLGMPRSGSTLIEQILASHPLVTSVGETDALARVMSKFAVGTPVDFSRIADDELAQVSADYLADITRQAPDASRIIDKMPFNFLNLGLIQLALPRAHVIHTYRNPLDTCVSAFSSLFARGHEYSYDLRELGRVYRKYHELMAHWRCVLPPQSFLDVRYEDVVEDLEGQARRILEHCELPWDDRVLSFYEGRRIVKTASAAQVRNPIYRRSVGRWRVYEKHLGPLIEELGDLSDTSITEFGVS
jgi:tetratricopeptide (TPR) repeat protein